MTFARSDKTSVKVVEKPPQPVEEPAAAKPAKKTKGKGKKGKEVGAVRAFCEEHDFICVEYGHGR